MASDLKDKMLKKLKEFEDLIENREWILGSDLTVADFGLYEVLRVLRAWRPEMFSQELPQLVGFIQRFEHLPTIKAYRESTR